MTPVPFDLAQTAFLPPHVARTYAEDQPAYIPLPVVALEGVEGCVISRWTFTPEERAAIAAGEDLYIEMLTFHQPLQPIRPTVGLEDRCPMKG